MSCPSRCTPRRCGGSTYQRPQQPQSGAVRAGPGSGESGGGGGGRERGEEAGRAAPAHVADAEDLGVEPPRHVAVRVGAAPPAPWEKWGQRWGRGD